MVTVVAAIPAVQHAEVCTSGRTEVVTVAIIVTVGTVQMPGMSTAIGCIEYGASKEEVVTVWIAGIDAEVPVACAPIQWTVEVAGSDICLPLCIQQYVAEITVAALPVVTIDIIVTRHTHQVVEIDLIGGLILFISKIQLISHLIGQEQRLVASLFITHCLARCCYRQHC
jgi:hypothetical protein